MTPEFWKGKRVFLTGHTGFKGSWLAIWLHSMGAKVTGYALAPETTPNLYDAADIAEICDSIIADIRDLNRLQAAVETCKPDVVLHLAAQALVRESYDSPRDTYATNVMGTLNVLECVRLVAPQTPTLVVTTDKCYENRGWVWGYRETDELGGHDPYSSSKACAEILTSSYRRSFPQLANTASARAGNVIGGGDWAKDRLLPDIIRAWLDGQPVELRSPNATRPWQHVLEPLGGYLTIAEKLGGSEDIADAWNFGPDGVATVAEVVDGMTAHWPGANWTDVSDPANQSKKEAAVLHLDSTKAKSLLGWNPKLSLPMCLQWTAEWYSAFAEGKSAQALCLEQINQYQSL